MRQFLAILLTITALTGCSGDSGTEQSETAPAAGASRLEQRAEIERWNSYVDLGNTIDTSFYRAMNAYFEAFGNTQEYRSDAASEAIDNFVAAMPSPQILAKAIDQAEVTAAKESRSDLDLAVSEVTPHLKSLWSALAASKAHHAGRKHLLEGDTVAAQLHTQIYESYQGLAATYDRFRNILNQTDTSRRKTDLKTMIDQGLVIRPAMLQLLDNAQALQDFLSSRSIVSGTLSGLDLEVFEPLYNEFVASFQDYEKAALRPDQMKKESLKPAVIETFSRQAMLVRASAGELLTLRKNRATITDDPMTIAGTPEHFAAVLGELVDLYNSALNQ